MAQYVVALGLLRDILKENGGGLNELDVDVSVVQIQNADEMLQHIVLAEKVKICTLVLL